jgi:hypothetical protein
MKVCSLCNIEKPLIDFNNQKYGKLGKRSYCRVCQSDMKKKYNSENRERITEYQRKYRQLNPTYNIEYQKKRRESDVTYRMIGNIRSRICNIIKGKTQKTLECLGMDVISFKIYIQNLFESGMSWENYGEWEIDHKIPISSAKDQNDVCKLNHYSNLQPLWKYQNKRKSNKITF